ncbi:hypothetical protein CPCDC_4g3660 [Cryptosporidium sp. 43IA8]|nr:hypothetical protein CPCDC_4g3660 [Cryptosporidium sp. 43IA8]
MNLKWACFNNVSILHLKANYLNLEGGSEFEDTESQEPLSSSEEYLRLSKIQLDHSEEEEEKEEEEEEEEKKTERMSCRSINILFAHMEEAKSEFSYRVYCYDNLKLGQNCENFLDELVAMSYPLKAKSSNNLETSDSGQSLHDSSSSSKSSRGNMSPTISYINKMKDKGARASSLDKKGD